VHDQFTERSLLFLAEDFTELMPLTLSSLYQPNDVGTGNPVNPLGNSTSVTPSTVVSARSVRQLSTLLSVWRCSIPGFFPHAKAKRSRASALRSPSAPPWGIQW
jgi:hypothetical protein